MNFRQKSILLLLLFNSISCKEIYDPALDMNISGIVIEGTITNEPGPYYVSLSKPIPFKGSSKEPIQEAKVFIQDDRSNTYNFFETSPGTYSSDPLKFTANVGYTYILIVQTKDNKAYRSSPQTLYPEGILDSIHAVIRDNTMTVYSNGLGARINNIHGADFIGNIDIQNDPSPYYRFSNMLLVEYTKQYTWVSSGPDPPQYCWIKYIPYDFMNLSETRSNSGKTPQILGFCPLDTTFYGIQYTPLFSGSPAGMIHIGDIFMKPVAYAITFKQYHLNEDVYNYYKAVNEQLSAKQQVLDPAIIQCIGNITCTTNPAEHVMGVFEAISITRQSLMYKRELNRSLDIESLNSFDVSKIENDNCSIGSPPDFWIY